LQEVLLGLKTIDFEVKHTSRGGEVLLQQITPTGNGIGEQHAGGDRHANKPEKRSK
jgi:hypothetical protein